MLKIISDIARQLRQRCGTSDRPTSQHVVGSDAHDGRQRKNNQSRFRECLVKENLN